MDQGIMEIGSTQIWTDQNYFKRRRSSSTNRHTH